MRLISLIVSTFLVSTLSYGQRYNSMDILKKSDSIMKAKVGERIFNKYLHYDRDAYYEYRSFWGKRNWETLTHNRRTKGKFKTMDVRYLFCLDTFDIPCILTGVEFDSALNQVGNIDVSFIPDYVLQDKRCNFISDSIALQIAKTTFTKRGIKPVAIGLSYDRGKGIYFWSASNIVTESVDGFGSKYGQSQYIEIDALTGKVITFYPDAIYAPVR